MPTVKYVLSFDENDNAKAMTAPYKYLFLPESKYRHKNAIKANVQTAMRMSFRANLLK